MSQWPRRRPLFSNAPVHKKPEKKWRWRYTAWTGLKRLCMLVGASVLISAMFSCSMISVAMREAGGPVVLPEQMVLYMPLTADYPEYHQYAYGDKLPTMQEVSAALDAARTDDRVKGLMASLRGGSYSMAHLYELRGAIKRFRDSGKFAYFYVSSFAEQGQGMGSYYLASAFDEIWMQPMGALILPGIKAEVPYARELLNKIGVTPDMFARKEYKNVFESFTATDMSEPTREVLTAMVGDIALQLRTDIAADRGMTPEALQALIDRGLLLDKEAQSAGLVDALDYVYHLTERIKKDVTGDPESTKLKFVGLSHYVRNHKPAGSRSAGNAKVALIYAQGAIVPQVNTASMPGVFMGGPAISAVEMSETLYDAMEDDDIEVIVIRINSPGGSPAASETLRARILQAQEKGKKVIVSMGDAAASGGYWMVAPADRIFATPLTLTGSIGVAGGKFVLADMWAKIGVNWDGVEWGDNAGMMSSNALYSETERARYGAMMDNVYDGFVARVAEGRKMDPVKAESLAHGRVWTGNQAQARGLVDEIGGLDQALDYAAAQVGAKDRHAIALKILPEPETAWERLAEFLEMQSGIGQWFGKVMGVAHVATHGDDFMVYEPVRVR